MKKNDLLGYPCSLIGVGDSMPRPPPASRRRLRSSDLLDDDVPIGVVVVQDLVPPFYEPLLQLVELPE